jgi:hypothetical protein
MHLKNACQWLHLYWVSLGWVRHYRIEPVLFTNKKTAVIIANFFASNLDTLNVPINLKRFNKFNSDKIVSTFVAFSYNSTLCIDVTICCIIALIVT